MFVCGFTFIRRSGYKRLFGMNPCEKVEKYWHEDEWIEERFDAEKDFDYSQIDSLKAFEGTHPLVMQEGISKMNWEFDKDPSQKKFGFKAALLYYIEKHTVWRIGEHRNFRILK